MPSNEMIFPCEQCGACCKSAGIKLLLPTKEDGSCEHLNGNDCTIYDHRPEICNCKDSYDRYYSTEMTWEEYVDISKRICQVLRELQKNK
jgi:hypothetical protein